MEWVAKPRAVQPVLQPPRGRPALLDCRAHDALQLLCQLIQHLALLTLLDQAGDLAKAAFDAHASSVP